MKIHDGRKGGPMSDWTVDTLKEHLTSLFSLYREGISNTFVERDKAIAEFKSQTDAKFASRNEIQQSMKDAAEAASRETAKLTATFISRSEAMYMILACCTITGTIIMVVTFFTRK
jgi:hypothetical protein